MESLEQALSKYATSQDLMDQIRYIAEMLSIDFTRWDEQYVNGPGLYFLVVADTNFDDYTDALGANKWPVDRCQVITDTVSCRSLPDRPRAVVRSTG